MLLLTTQLPYPPVSGGTLKTWNLVKHWSKHYDLYLITLIKNDDADHERAFKSKVSLGGYFSIEVDKPRTPLNFLKSLVESDSLNIYRNKDSGVTIKAKQWITLCDVVVIDHYEMMQYAKHQHSKPIVLHTHNAEFVMWQRLAKLQKNPIKKLLLAFEANRIKQAEQKYCQRANRVFAAPHDIEMLDPTGKFKDKMHVTYHLGDDSLLKEPAPEFKNTTKEVLFIATLSWEANVDGIVWFLNKIWTLVLAKEPQAMLKITGRNPDKRILDAAEKFSSVELTGFVENLVPLYNRARAYVVPLRFGSGIKVKLLNAMYAGVPVVTTEVGCEGLDFENGKHLLLGNDENTFANHVVNLLSNEELYNNLSAQSRALARAKYSWQALHASHDKVLNELLNQ